MYQPDTIREVTQDTSSDVHGGSDTTGVRTLGVDRTEPVETTSNIPPKITWTGVKAQNVNASEGPDGDGFEERCGSRVGSQNYDLRPRRQPKYTTDHLLMSSNCFPTLQTSFHFPQMNVTTAIRRHGQRALDAVFKEVKQLDAMDALHVVYK